MRRNEIFLEKNDNEEEITLDRLEKIKEFAELDLKELGFEEYKVKDVVHFNEEVELTNKKTGKPENFKLYIAVTENSKAKENQEAIFEIEYLVKGDKVYTINDLIHEYEGFENIRDVIERAKENEKLPKEKQDKRFKTHRLSEEREKQKDKNNLDKDKKEKSATHNLADLNQKSIMQIIDVDKAYVEEWKTVRKAFGIPAGIEKIAIAKPFKGDSNALSPDLTIYMIDENGNIVDNANDKTVKDIFKVDRAIGKNAADNKSTQIGLDGESVERTDGQIMRSFRSIENPDLFLTTNKKKVGEYTEVFAGRKSKDGNDFVGVQLETRNVEYQTDLDKQRLVSGYKGIYNADNIDNEVDTHVEHGDDEKKIPIKNSDGNEKTLDICDSPYIPGTEMTWEELSERTGEGIKKLQERFGRELENGKEPKDIVDEIEYDYGMIEHTRNRV